MWHVWGKTVVQTRFWGSRPDRRHILQDLDVDGRAILKLIFKT